MRRIVAALGVFAAASLAIDATAKTEIRRWEGAERLPLAAASLDGRKVDLRDLQGRVVLVNFWATWCEPCRDEMPAIARLQEKLKGQPFDVLAVNYGESRERIAEFVKREGISLRVVLDPDKQAAEAWKAKGLPMTCLVDAGGRVRYWAFGEMDWNAGEAVALVEQLMAEAPHAGR